MLSLVSFTQGFPVRVRIISVRSKKPANASSTGRSRGLDSEYRFDYSKAKPNRFASQPRVRPVVVVLAPDVAKVFKDGESVNAVLRAIVKALPRNGGAD